MARSVRSFFHHERRAARSCSRIVPKAPWMSPTCALSRAAVGPSGFSLGSSSSPGGRSSTMLTSRAVLGVVGVRGRGWLRTHTRGQTGLSRAVALPRRQRAREVGPVTNRRYSGLLHFLAHRQPALERVAPTGTGFTPARAGSTPLTVSGRGMAACGQDLTLSARRSDTCRRHLHWRRTPPAQPHSSAAVIPKSRRQPVGRRSSSTSSTVTTPIIRW